MNEPTPDLKSPSFWTKNIIQGIVVYNSLFHKNVDPQVGLIVLAAVESAYHAVQGLIHAAHALKDGLCGKVPPVPPAASNG